MENLEEAIKQCPPEQQKTLKEFVALTADTIREKKLLEAKNSLLTQMNRAMTHELRILKKLKYSSSSEKIAMAAADQLILPLFNDVELIADQAKQKEAEEKSAVEEKNKSPKNATATQAKKPGRKPLPKDLPRTVVQHDLPDNEKICVCGDTLVCIGKTVTEKLRYQPATFEVIEHHCKKYGCQTCNKKNALDPNVKAVIKAAASPPSILPKSFATPELITQIVLQKFQDALPLYRQEQVFSRAGIALSRQTMSQWVLRVSDLLVPIVNLIEEQVTACDLAFSDETTLQVLHEQDKKPQSRSYMWCFIGVEKERDRAQGDGPPKERVAVVYQYHPGRGAAVCEGFFEGFKGALHSDGYAGYQKLIARPQITGVNCFAHVRRKFFEALPNGKLKGLSGQVMRLIQGLYQIESALKEQGASPDEIKQARQEQSKPILENLKALLEKHQTSTPSQFPVGKAIHYTLKRWPYLITYLEDGRYEIDNNRAERAIKPFVIGRKNWLFSNTPSGAHSSARLYTLIETAKANGLKPEQYLNHIFNELPRCSTVEDYEALLPWNVHLHSN